MARQQKRYTDEERATLVAMLAAKGYPDTPGALKAVATYAQVHENVLRRWFNKSSNPPPTTIVSHKKRDMADALEEVAWKLLDSLGDEDAIADAPLQQRATAYGIAVDKMRLLRGLPTEIVQLIPGVVEAIQSMGQSPADVFNRIIQRAKQRTDS